jgi:hypothetical protein
MEFLLSIVQCGQYPTIKLMTRKVGKIDMRRQSELDPTRSTSIRAYSPWHTNKNKPLGKKWGTSLLSPSFLSSILFERLACAPVLFVPVRIIIRFL